MTDQTARARVEAHILKPMQRIYEVPPGPAEYNRHRRAALVDDYVDALGGFPEAVLKAAWEQVRRTHSGWWWPPAGLFLAAAENAAKALAPAGRAAKSTPRNR